MLTNQCQILVAVLFSFIVITLTTQNSTFKNFPRPFKKPRKFLKLTEITEISR